MLPKFFRVLLGLVLVSAAHGSTKGGWAGWSEWSSWGKGLCSGNQRVKTRACTNPLPDVNGDYCDGDNAVQESGPVDGGLSEWSQWSTCEVPCGGSVVNRTRICDNPPPSNGGSSCRGNMLETKLECVMECPEGRTDGDWSPWSGWSACPKTCTKNGGALIRRYRQCNMPPPMFGGKACPGNSTEIIRGCYDICPLHGGFGGWSSFTECSKTCGSGVMSRKRLCNNPVPNGETSRNCTGVFSETKHCKLVDCIGAINGNWAHWAGWSKCTEKQLCFKGQMKRSRTCTNPAPNQGGDSCNGAAEEVEICPIKNCKDDRPTPSPTLPVHPGDYIHRECGGINLKYIGTSAPAAVLRHLNFQISKFKGGYYGMQEEEKGSIKKYCFEPFPPLTIKEAADAVPSYRKTDPIPEYAKPTDESLPILGFSVRVTNDNNADVKGWDFGINEAYEYIPGNKVRLNNVMFTYYSDGTFFGFLAKSEFRLFSPTIFKSLVFRNASFVDDVSSMIGSASTMKLGGLVNAIGLPDDLNGVAGTAIAAIKNLGIWNFEFGPVTIAYDFKHEFKAPFRISATKSFGGIPLHFEVIYIHSGWDRKIAFGFTFDGESFGSALDKMAGTGSVGKAVSGFLNKIGLQVEMAIAWCPSFFGSFKVSKTTRFSKEPLKDLYKFEIPEGLTAVAAASIPKDCGDSSFCDILKAVVGPKARFRISGNVKKGYYKVTAGFYKIKITGNYYFNKLELFAEVNTTASKKVVGFKAEVKIPVNVGEIIIDGITSERSLILGGLLKHTLGTSDLTGALYMKGGIWYHAFGLNWLNIGNIHLAITITIGSPTVLTGFQFGAQLDFGKNCIYDADFAEEGHCLRFAIYFGYGKPTYFYGKISSLTIGKLVRMCGGPTSLPGPVHSAGFPEGLRVQYNPSGKDVDLRSVGGPLVQNGFRLKGVLDLFGYQIKAEIKYSDREIYIDGELDPINLGGHLIMARNASHTNVGPKLLFHFKRAAKGSLISLPYFKMYFEGYVKVLGIEASAYLNITMQQLEIYIYGKVWNLIYAELYIAAGYDYTSITDAHFYIRVIVDLRGLTDAIEKARQSVDKAFKDAQKQLRNAIDKVKEAKQKCKEKLKIKCSNCYSLKCKQAENNCKGFLDKAGKWIGGVINKAGQWIKNTARKIGDGLAKVGRAVKSFFKGWRRRRSLLAQRDENFDIHIRNRRFISKFICEGIVGGGCKGISHLCYGTCKAVDFIGQGLCSVLDVAVGALKLAEKACGWISAAIQFIMQMFLVHGIRFELGLGQKFNGFMVAAEIDLTLFGNRMYFGFSFDLKNPFRSIMSAKDGSLYRYKAGVRQLRTEPTYNPYDRPNPFSDFDLAGTFGIESLQTGTENRVGGCIAALTSRDKDQLVMVGCNATDERQRWTYTLKGALINLYSKKCLVMSKTVGGNVYQNNCEKETRSQAHECDVVTRTLKLRRSSLCVTSAKSSSNGPGSLVHLGSLKCIHQAPNQRLVIRSGCNRVDTDFEINSSGHLIFKARNLCARPVSNNAVSGAKIELVSPSVGCHKFAFTRLGSLQHIQSRLCIQTAQREMVPREYAELILDSKCEFAVAARDSGSLPDPQMTFTFVPNDNKLTMQECADFYDSKLEQRFAVLNEELNSVCSKFATDVALNKIASQSSIQHNGFPSRAVDGDFNFQWEKGSCTHTKEETDPWWRVDLGREYIVTDVTIINRGDHGERLRNIQVHVGGNLNVRKNPVCHDLVRQAHDGEAIRLQCDPPIPGQFVGIQMYGKGILSVCEVIVASRLGGLADWCLIENGGCEQICNNKCGRETSCSCLPGYTLAYDGRTCLDVNECLSNNGGCRSDKQAYCVNYPGGFYCACKKGYILKDDNLKECVDINECGTRNGGCEQMCNNTLGGYMCNCRKGYERKPNDPYGCQNINECLKENGGCDHTCYDYDGGHFCKCKPGFRLMEDGKSCEELYCSVLEGPRWGVVSPSTCTKKYQNIPVGSVCKYECAKGYEIKSQTKSTTLSCRIDGTWNHASPSCHPVKCPILPRPANGGVIPARCHDTGKGYSEYGQRCVSYCKHGYRLRGPATKYCQADKQWSNASPVECIEVIEPPYLNCPNDIEATLSATSNWLTLGPLWLNLQTNVNTSTIKVRPENVGANYKFAFGRHLISYTAVHETGVVLACSFFVEVKDKTPPVVKNCPSDIIKTSSSDREVISWTEPSFSDNVGIREISTPYRKPGSIWESGESGRIQYIATDEAGNDRICSFTVSFKSLMCPELTSTTSTTIVAYYPRRRYAVTCVGQRTLFGNYGFQGSVAYCKNGDYYLEQTNIGVTTPECVGYVKSDASSTCQKGSEKFIYDDWFAGKSYYCAQCPSGTWFNTTSSKCENCIVGMYQDEQGKTSCEMCPLGTSTMRTGAHNVNQCIERCTPGHFSASGLNEAKEQCKPCPRGTYTYLNGTTVCTSCPDKATTRQEGATDMSECYKPTKITRTNPSKTTAGHEQSNIEIECFFEGLPVPNALWSKVNGQLPALRSINYIYDLNVNVIGSSLTLYRVSADAAGTYKCSIDNGIGRDEKSIQVGVIPKSVHGRK